MSEWHPTVEDMRSGRNAYIRYLSGVAVINAPHAAVGMGITGEGYEGSDELLLTAEGLIYSGLRDVIKHANPPAHRTVLQDYAEHNFELALPHMQSIVDDAYARELARINTMNASFFVLQPAPMLSEKIYKALCHSRLGKLQTRILIDGVQPAQIYRDKLANRTLQATA